ncbi:MAG: radical SAM protein [Kiloniellales bacterium]|nr:radical SAM protein [Kiloniellales bacterium]
MAGAKDGNFKELISPFLKAKIAEAEATWGAESAQVLALTRQYVKDPLENLVRPIERRRHYESEVSLEYLGRKLVGVERLYRRTILIEPSTVCAAHCRWCLRGQYPVQTMTRDDIVHAARYIGSEAQRGDLDEVLITGGDPLMSLPLLRFTFEALESHAPNVRIVRIGSRVPFQDPDRINDAMLEMFASFKGFRFEIGVNVNHPVEFWSESVESIRRLQAIGVRFYNQHPLLKGVNDDLETLVEHYGLLRDNDIEAHYLFHAIPMRGMSHHRTSVDRGLELATALSSCGEFSGRAKPHYAVLSDIGKIVLYHDSIVERRPAEQSLLLRSGFNIHDRKKWNPSWQKPESAVVLNDGTMLTWYLDGTDETDAELAAAHAS